MIGRSEELAVLTAMLDSVSPGGEAAVVSGQAGIGKTTLAAALSARARHVGFRELRCTGVQSEATAGFAGLHELLRPVLDDAVALPARQRAALRSAFGESDGPADRLLIHLAVLGLLEEVAHRQRLLVVVEDLQWLDRSSAEALEFVARRLSNAPILMVATVRTESGEPTPLPSAQITRLHLEPLPEVEAALLLDGLPHRLGEQERRQILAEAAGNPLAVREFAAAVSARDGGPAPAGPLPTTARLERALLAEVDALPEASRRFLLLAAVADVETLPELVAAGRLLDLTPEDLAPAEDAGTVTLVGERVRFRHPLLRSAVRGAATWSDRAAAHTALAAATPDPGRAAWHRAALAFAPDETIAAELEAAARRSLQRGARPDAVVTLRRAAALSVDTEARARRLIAAAVAARQGGRAGEAVQLLEEALPLATAADVVATAASTEVMLGVTVGTPVRPVGEAVALAERLSGSSGDDHRTRRAQVLVGAAAWAWLQGVDEPAGNRLAGALTALDPEGGDPMVAIGSALVDPVAHAARARAALPGLTEFVSDYAYTGGTENHPGSSELVLAAARMAESIQDLSAAATLWDLGALFFRGGTGALSDEAQVVTGRGALRLATGRLDEGLADSAHGERLAEALDLPVLAGLAAAAAARGHAWSGADEAATRAGARALELSGEHPAALVRALVAWAAGLRALGRRRHDEALAALRDVSVHPSTALLALADLTEAAVRSGAASTVEPVVAEGERVAEALRSVHLQALVHRSRALLAPGADAADHFEAAVEAGRRAGSPLELARSRLAWGEWLRRHGQVVSARGPLAEALHVFDTEGAAPWAELAAAELRAAGVVPSRSVPSTRIEPAEVLTAQELQIARLAASGLTNKAIADRVYLSHRTIGAHLYRIYPKVGVTSRGQLRDVLGPVGG
ncbi:helix-turn-helix transcriptional regulator [Blastococcus sp. SYSU DS0617]